MLRLSQGRREIVVDTVLLNLISGRARVHVSANARDGGREEGAEERGERSEGALAACRVPETAQRFIHGMTVRHNSGGGTERSRSSWAVEPKRTCV